MEDVPEVYKRPYDPCSPQVCMDGVSERVLRDTRAPLPIEPGKPERVDYEYERGGVANIFLFCEPLAGRRRVDVTQHRTKADRAEQIEGLVDRRYPRAERIVPVMDNLNTHTPASPYEAFPPGEAKRLADKLEIHHAPKHGGRLNMSEIELGVLSRQCLDRRAPDSETLRSQVEAWQERRDAKGGEADWRFTTEDARIKPKRLYPSIEE